MAEPAAEGVATLAAQELLRGLRAAVDEVFATMVSTLGVGARYGDTCLARGDARTPGAITVEARIDITGPLQGFISLSCTADAAGDLARGMLRLGPGEVLSTSEVEDALGECANMVAGVLKSALLDPRGSFTIAVPRHAKRDAGATAPRGALAYRLCAGSLEAALWLEHGGGAA